MSVDDLRRVDLPKLDWSDPERALSQMYEYVLDHARDAEAWYAEKRRPKKRWGQFLRITAIILVGVGALIPVLSETLTNDGEPLIPPAWASVALIVAATLVGLDRYFGFSTGWTRFMVADLEIGRLRRGFEFAWHQLEAPAGGSGGDPLARLKLAQGLVQAVDRVVADETNTWTDEFKAALDTAINEFRQQPQNNS